MIQFTAATYETFPQMGFTFDIEFEFMGCDVQFTCQEVFPTENNAKHAMAEKLEELKTYFND